MSHRKKYYNQQVTGVVIDTSILFRFRHTHAVKREEEEGKDGKEWYRGAYSQLGINALMHAGVYCLSGEWRVQCIRTLLSDVLRVISSDFIHCQLLHVIQL